MNSDLLGQKVTVPGAAGYGYIKYLGPIQNKSGLFVGLELIGTVAKTRGKNSGSVEGVQYFHVKVPKSGLFLPYERVKNSNSHLPEISLQNYQNNLHSNINNDIITPKRSHFYPISENKSPTRQHVYYTNQNQQQHTASMRSPLSPVNTYQNVNLNLLQNDFIKSENNKDYEIIIKELKTKLNERDRKLENFGKQREEWHQAMDSLIAVQQEGIQVFEEKIMELEGINKTQEEEIQNLKIQLEGLGKENGELRSSIKSNKEENEQSIELEKLKLELSAAKENLSANENKQQEVEKLQAQLDEKNEQLENYTIQLSGLEELKEELKQSQDKIIQLETQRVTKTIESVNINPTSQSSNLLQLNSQDSNEIIQDSNNNVQDLPIYKSPNLIDPSSGKSDWCGLCERDGHSSINCPFENDIF
ncbi:uncharacterized protein KGF55_004222 [Candida pseudojiufengensis]|uniref:uncharacterized protein n=1 Tax=Candida pseudojiufengensis TaxID=497109 RepID=UPI0022247993|nr:uncharacterized protein KGF55_004222 [Candida pseudojiufengensis]KAI5960955.1 hypothetical protein KGF55_004222 [Candida pseudojiufengensis]